ncbi:hypothetical protein OEG84_24985 [Hoeflea sp. G2-23]|uniref:Uncharacterized protein n=1 Tax=Hoeflea algicola TaxID=2983763 RepID=A0ABT3ZGN9_9HYPH|nr:hypothetical protein [Hoeflea algicola]MCY0146152.1 hypothetical protein [Hoeflea algicola]MCY0150863.1 hypothetical protein [Hoeflea algicola]
MTEAEKLKRVIAAMKDELMKIETEGGLLGRAVVEPIDKAIKLAQSVEN